MSKFHKYNSLNDVTTEISEKLTLTTITRTGEDRVLLLAFKEELSGRVFRLTVDSADEHELKEYFKE